MVWKSSLVAVGCGSRHGCLPKLGSHTVPRLGSGINSGPETVLALHCQSFLLRQGVKNEGIHCCGLGCCKQQVILRSNVPELFTVGCVKEGPVGKQNRQCSYFPWKNLRFLLLLEWFILLLTMGVLITTWLEQCHLLKVNQRGWYVQQFLLKEVSAMKYGLFQCVSKMELTIGHHVLMLSWCFYLGLIIGLIIKYNLLVSCSRSWVSSAYPV